MTLRTRILLALAPLAVLLAALGVAGFLALDRVGGRIGAILQENYVSVQAMFRLDEAAERIDASFQFALAGREADARAQFDANWAAFDEQFKIEAANVTLHPAEDELVARLDALKSEYRIRGNQFFALPPADRPAAYPALRSLFQQIKQVSAEILRLNRENMERTRDDAHATARSAIVWFAAGLAVVALLVAGAGWYLVRAILGPIRELTDAAQAVGAGHLNRDVPTTGPGELGHLAGAFNAMTAQLRGYRQTNLAKLLRAQKTAQATVDSFPDPVLVLDPTGRVELSNPAARLLLGVGPGSDWLPPPELSQPVCEALRVQATFAAEGFDQAVTFRLGGDDRAYLPHVRPIRDPDGDTLGAAVVLTDITRFRMLDQFKTDLVATVSHELKTPLTGVRLAVHVLLEEAVGPLTPKQTELLVDARDNAERLLALIEQLLALARLQRPGARTQSEDPAELLRRAADAARPRADDKHVELVVEVGGSLPAVAVDADRFAQALGNLVENAVTYTPAGGRVTLSAVASDSGVTLVVADTGVGIPAEHLPHVFERFFRVPGQSEEGGTGLGLAIAKEVAVSHGGDLVVESAPGQGTTFRLTLPLGNAERGAQNAE